jgi:hypothetical protein
LTGQIGETLGLLLAVGRLAAQMLDHPTGGIGFGSKSCLVPLFCQEGSFQLSEGKGPLFGVIGFQLLGQLADGGGELLGLDAQPPEGAGTQQGAGRTCR